MPVTSHDAATDVLDRAEALLALDVESANDQLRQDFRRLALAMGVAALDTYLHWAIRAVSLNLPSQALRKVKTDFGDLVDSGKVSIESRRANRRDRPQVRARNVLNRYLLTRTFQSAEEVQQAMALAGVKDCFSRLAHAIQPPETGNALRTRLNALSYRRNKIVHEGDLVRQVKPSRLAHEKIRHQEVADDLSWLRRFIDALHIVIP